MEAITFVSEIENGKIVVPVKYRDALHKKVQVIILVEPKKTVKKPISKKNFKAFKTKGFKFDRDEANAR